MKNEDNILIKISKLLKVPFNQECQVLHLMVEIRKFIELKNKYTNFEIIKFYCDWCVHVKLSGKYAQKKLKKISVLIEKNDGLNEDMFYFLELNELKQELLKFFLKQNLESENFITKWNNFNINFINILINSPLVIEKATHGEIESFEFKKSISKNEIMCNIVFKKEDGGNGIQRRYFVGNI